MKANTSPRSPGRTFASSVALLGALGLMGFSGSAQAGVIFQGCTAEVIPERTSAVTDIVGNPDPGVWTYEFTVFNTSDDTYGGGCNLLRDWELPWDHTASNPIDPDSIEVPFGWAWSIETRGEESPGFLGGTGWDGEITWQDPDDPFFDPRFQDHPQVLHFYTNCGEGFEDANFVDAVGPDSPACFDLPRAWIREGESLSGFSFTASVGPTNAPYQASWISDPPRSGDPAFPLAGGTALSRAFFAVPEPSSLLLLGASLGGIVGAAALRRRRKDQEPEDSGHG